MKMLFKINISSNMIQLIDYYHKVQISWYGTCWYDIDTPPRQKFNKNISLFFSILSCQRSTTSLTYQSAIFEYAGVIFTVA